MQHVGRIAYRGQDLHYGTDAANRYDDPAGHYGVLYLGMDLPTALMESVFHKHDWLLDSKRTVALAEVNSRLVRAVGVLDPVCLCDLTAPGVMAGHFGLNLEQLTGRDYTHTQRISAHIHALKRLDARDLFDGILYPSRKNFPAASIAVFDRARHKLAVSLDIDLALHADWPRFVADYEVGIVAGIVTGS